MTDTTASEVKDTVKEVAVEKPVEAAHEAVKVETPPPSGSDVPDWAKGLIAQVESLSETVASLAPVSTDSVPTGRPWTHRGSR